MFMYKSNLTCICFNLTFTCFFGICGLDFIFFPFNTIDTENIKLVFCAVKDTIMQSALKEFNLA